MNDNDSDYSGVWWILILSLMLGIVFFFDKDIWPQLSQPILRCLVAPVAGVVLLVGWYLFYIVLPSAALQIIWKVCLWLTTPRFVFLTSLLVAVGTAASLLLGWVVVPIIFYWAMIDSVAISTTVGFILVRLVRIFGSDSWGLKTVIALPVSTGLAYWIVIKLQPVLEIGWIIMTISIMIIFLIRFLYDEDQRSKKVVNHFQRASTSYLPQDMKEQILKQIREQIGITRYNQLVSTVGEDEIINQVLANMQKT